MRIRQDNRRVYTFGYLDESATNHRFFGTGLLVHGPGVSGVDDLRLNEHIRGLKTKSGIRLRGDVGWKKVPGKEGQYLELYRRFVDGFFKHPQLSFHCVIVDTQRLALDSKRYFRGSKDAGIDAFCFHLIRRRILRYCESSEHLCLRLDRRSRPPSEAITKLATRVRSEVHRIAGPTAPRVSIRSITGGRHPLIQVADLLLGAVTASLNKKTSKNTKLDLMDRLSSRLGRPLGDPTSSRAHKFTVWRFDSDAAV